MIQESDREFKYSLTRKNAFLVVVLAGPIAKSVLEKLESCRREILDQTEVRAMVLDFAEVTDIGIDTIPILAQLQQAIRSRQIHLRICSLAEPLLEKLQRKGVIRMAEISRDLKDAIGALARA